MVELVDNLNVLSSAEFIVQNAENVSIIKKGVENAVNIVSFGLLAWSKQPLLPSTYSLTSIVHMLTDHSRIEG